MKLSLTNHGLCLHYSSSERYTLFFNYGMHVLEIMPTANGSIGHESFSLERPSAEDICSQNDLDLNSFEYVYRGIQNGKRYLFHLDRPDSRKALTKE